VKLLVAWNTPTRYTAVQKWFRTYTRDEDKQRKMDLQQMMELLLKEIRTNQEKAESDRKADKEEIKTGHKELLAKMEADRKAAQEDLMAKLDADRAQTQEFMKTLQAYQAKTGAVLLAIQETETSHKETAAVIETENEVETMACQGMEARPEEEKPTSADRKPEAAEEYEVPIEDAEVIPVGEPKKKRRKDRKLVTEHHRQKPKTSPRENCGPQKRRHHLQRDKQDGKMRKWHGRRQLTGRCPVARQWHDT
jgi:hypothetical protein